MTASMMFEDKSKVDGKRIDETTPQVPQGLFLQEGAQETLS